MVARIVAWYDVHRRDLPWRAPDATPWGVMVSEFMLQQTPVNRVIGPWLEWLRRWPTPSALAAVAPGDAVRAWGRLGYPRRAQRLHAAATEIVRRHHGQVPASIEALRALPGVGDYTAAAIASFAFGQRHVVLDTNVRRVLARLATGHRYPAASLTVAERALADRWAPSDATAAARWAAASMELGATVCLAQAPDCARCPVSDACAYVAAGTPEWDGPSRRAQDYEGTDRQCRGALLAVVRGRVGAVGMDEVLAAWPHEPAQARRCLDSLLTDGLLTRTTTGGLRL